MLILSFTSGSKTSNSVGQSISGFLSNFRFPFPEYEIVILNASLTLMVSISIFDSTDKLLNVPINFAGLFSGKGMTSIFIGFEDASTFRPLKKLTRTYPFKSNPSIVNTPVCCGNATIRFTVTVLYRLPFTI